MSTTSLLHRKQHKNRIDSDKCLLYFCTVYQWYLPAAGFSVCILESAKTNREPNYFETTGADRIYIFCLLSVFTYIQYYKISTRFSISIVSRLNASCHRHHHHDSSLHLAGKIIERMPKMQSRIFQNQVCGIKMLLQCWCNYFI